MNHSTTILDTLSTIELFDVLPTAATRTAPLTESEQIHRWEPLTGDPRDASEIVGVPALRAGTTYWVKDALHALVLRQAARSEAPAAEVLWDLEMEQYAVMVATSMSPSWE